MSTTTSASKSWFEGVLDTMSGLPTVSPEHPSSQQTKQQQNARISDLRSITSSSVNTRKSYVESLKEQSAAASLQRQQSQSVTTAASFVETDTDDDWTADFTARVLRDTGEDVGGDDTSCRAMEAVCGSGDHFCGSGDADMASAQPKLMPPTATPPKAMSISDLQRENATLLARTQTLIKEKEDALSQANLLHERMASTSDVTVQTLQQRCQTAEAQNQHLEQEIAELKVAAVEQKQAMLELLEQQQQQQQADEKSNLKSEDSPADSSSQPHSQEKIRELEQQFADLQSEYAAKRSQESSSQQQQQLQQEHIRELEQKLADLQSENDRLREEHAASRAEKSSSEQLLHQKQIRELEQKLAGLQSENGRLQEEHAASRAEKSSSVQQQQLHQEQIRELEQKHADLQSENGRLQEEHAAAVENLDTKLIQAKEACLKKESELQTALEQVRLLDESIGVEIEPVVTDIQILSQRDDTIAELREQCIDYSRQMTALTEAKARDLQKAGDEKTRVVEALQQELDSARKDLVELQNQIDASEQEHNTTVADMEATIEKVHMEAKKGTDHEIEELQKTAADMEIKYTEVCESVEHLTLQLHEAKQNHCDVVADWEDTVEKLEAELEGKKEAERRVEDLTASVHDLEAKYGNLERQLLEAKLELAAAEEQKEQLAEDHESSLAALRKEKSQLAQDHEQVVAALKEYEVKLDLVETEKACLERTQTANLVAVRKLTALEDDDGGGGVDEKKLDDETSAAASTDERSMTAEIDRLARALQRKKERLQLNATQSSSAEEELRQQLEMTRQNENSLRKQLSVVSKDSEQNVRELQEQLDDRDQTIATLVKSSTRLEQELRERLEKAESTAGNSAPHQPRGLLSTAENGNIEALSVDVAELKEKLDAAESENSRLKAQLESSAGRQLDAANGSFDEEGDTGQTQLKERDDAIATLVKQSVAQGKVVAKLQAEIEQLKSDAEQVAKSDKVSSDEVKRLKEEAQVFASQVIELDDEIEKLKTELSSKEAHLEEMEKHLADAKKVTLPIDDSAQSAKIQNLEAEIDELKEANETQRVELRELRMKVREAEKAPDQIAMAKNEALGAKREADEHKRAVDELAQEKTAIHQELETTRAEKQAIEQTFSEKLAVLQQSKKECVSSLEKELHETRKAHDELMSSPSHMSEEEIEALRNELSDLKQRQASQTADIDSARVTIRQLEGELAERSASAAAANEEEREELLHEIESLTSQLENAREKIKGFEADEAIMNEFKQKLERADEAREESEKNIIDTYERKLSLLTLDKDVTIDKLRKELFLEKEANEEELGQMSEQMNQYQVEISELREELKEEVEKRDMRVMALEHTLAAQEQLVGNMKTEMDHLQGSMEGSAARRREEIDEMQQELLSMTAASAKQEREIQSLKLELQDKETRYKAEVDKLQETITSLEKAPNDRRTAADLQMELRVKEVKDRLEKLKWRNTSLREENENLRERLELAESMAKDSVDHERMREVEVELSKQLKKVKSLETELKNLKDPSEGRGKKPAAGTPKPPAVSTASPAQTERKTSAASPRRLKLFGRKSKTETTKPDEAEPLRE